MRAIIILARSSDSFDDLIDRVGQICRLSLSLSLLDPIQFIVCVTRHTHTHSNLSITRLRSHTITTKLYIRSEFEAQFGTEQLVFGGAVEAETRLSVLAFERAFEATWALDYKLRMGARRGRLRHWWRPIHALCYSYYYWLLVIGHSLLVIGWILVALLLCAPLYCSTLLYVARHCSTLLYTCPPPPNNSSLQIFRTSTYFKPLNSSIDTD